MIVGGSVEPLLRLCRFGGKQCAIDMLLKLVWTFSLLTISTTMLVTCSGIPSTSKLSHAHLVQGRQFCETHLVCLSQFRQV